MEQMINENQIYSAALYCRLSKDDEQAGESVSIGTQRMILESFVKSTVMGQILHSHTMWMAFAGKRDPEML